MDDLIGRLVANSGVDRTAAEKAVGIILQFPLEEGRAEYVLGFIGCMPGVDAEMPASYPDSSSLSMFGTIGGSVGVGTQLKAAGPRMGQIQAVTRRTMHCAREMCGKTQSAEASARFPASASSSDAR